VARTDGIHCATDPRSHPVAVVSDDRILCPSARCETGALLLGIVLPNGRVSFASDEIRLTEEFVAVAQEGRPPEKRFRFAQPCARGGCRQWTGSRCQVIDDVQVALSGTVEDDELPACSIRPRCRWFLQSGADACAVCPAVITDMRSAFLPD
jgi:hypothetical protein